MPIDHQTHGHVPDHGKSNYSPDQGKNNYSQEVQASSTARNYGGPVGTDDINSPGAKQWTGYNNPEPTLQNLYHDRGVEHNRKVSHDIGKANYGQSPYNHFENPTHRQPA